MTVVRRIRPDEGRALRDVRLAALADAPSAFGSTYARESLLTAEDWTDRARAGSAGSERATFFAVSDDGVVGLVGGFRLEPNSARVELVSMWTRPVARRAGVGRLLVHAVLDWARTCGVQAVELWVTRGNVGAERLYRAMGFVDAGDYQPLPSDPGREEVRMRFTCSSPDIYRTEASERSRSGVTEAGGLSSPGTRPTVLAPVRARQL
jgi:GNAT superfamily N-acetyltransferase